MHIQATQQQRSGSWKCSTDQIPITSATNDAVLLTQLALRLQAHDGHPMCPMLCWTCLRRINHGHLQNALKCRVGQNWTRAARKFHTDGNEAYHLNNWNTKINWWKLIVFISILIVTMGFKHCAAEQNPLLLQAIEEAEGRVSHLSSFLSLKAGWELPKHMY